MNRLLATMHHLLQQLHEQLCVECCLIGAVPETPFGIYRRGRADRLALTGTLHHRDLTAHCQGIAMNRIGAKSEAVRNFVFVSYTLTFEGGTTYGCEKHDPIRIA